MQINPTTTFSRILDEFGPGRFTTESGAKKHLRFDGGTKLYTHSSLVKSRKGEDAALDRARKHAAGADAVKRAIDNQYGAGTGERIFRRIAEHQGVNLDRGVRRSDLGLIQQTIRHERARAESTPASFTLARRDDGSAHIQGPFNEMAMMLLTTPLDEAIVGDRDKIEFGYPTVSETFWKDHVDRSCTLTLSDGSATQQVGKDTSTDARVGLRAFTGSDASARSLSYYLNQDVAHGLLMADSTLLQSESGNPIAVDANRKVSYAVTRTSGGDYLIDYRIEGRLNALRGGGAPLLADREQSSVSYSMQLKVSQADLESGNSRYEITGGPSYDINFVPDWRAMLTGSRD